MKCEWCFRDESSKVVPLKTVSFDSVDLYRNARFTSTYQVCYFCEAAFNRGSWSVLHEQAMERQMPKVWNEGSTYKKKFDEDRNIVEEFE